MSNMKCKTGSGGSNDQTGDSPQVLVIEDEEEIAEMYTEYLADSYEIRTANDGLAAMVQLSDEVDVVILDRNLGNWTGETILGVIQDKQLDCQVIMVTGEEPEPGISKFPIQEYLRKPVKLSKLKETIEEVLLRANSPRTEQELLSLISRKDALEDAFTLSILEASEEYQQLMIRIELAEEKLNKHPKKLPHSKFKPSNCSNCDLRWDIKLGNVVGFSALSSFVWKCNRCGNTELIRNPEKRSVARR